MCCGLLQPRASPCHTSSGVLAHTHKCSFAGVLFEKPPARANGNPVIKEIPNLDKVQALIPQHKLPKAISVLYGERVIKLSPIATLLYQCQWSDLRQIKNALRKSMPNRRPGRQNVSGMLRGQTKRQVHAHRRALTLLHHTAVRVRRSIAARACICAVLHRNSRKSPHRDVEGGANQGRAGGWFPVWKRGRSRQGANHLGHPQHHYTQGKP